MPGHTSKVIALIALMCTLVVLLFTPPRQNEKTSHRTSVRLVRKSEPGFGKTNKEFFGRILSLREQSIRHLPELRRQLDGDAVTQDSARFAAVMAGLSLFSEPPYNMPLIAVEAGSCRDVQRAIKFARRFRLNFRVRSGGHSYAGTSTCTGNCLVVRLAPLNRVEHVGSKIWRVGPGATTRQLAQTNAFPHGICAPVNMGGHVQGGGIGLNFRKLGLLADHVVGAHVMLANGKVIHATRTNRHKDLLWAIRGGGGGNWGVVLSYELKQRVNMATEFTFRTTSFIFPFELTYESLKAQLRHSLDAVFDIPIVDQAKTTPNFEYTPLWQFSWSQQDIFEQTKTTPVMQAVGGWMIPRGSQGAATETQMKEWLKKITEVTGRQGKPVRTSHHVWPTWAHVHNYMIFPLAKIFLPKYVVRSRISFSKLSTNEELLDGITRMFLKWKDNTDVYLRFQIFCVGKSEFFDEATSYPLRDALYSVDVFISARSKAGESMTFEAVQDFESMIGDTLSDREYINQLSRDDEWAPGTFETRLYGGKGSTLYRKLQRIKQRYDPTNFFKFSQSVRPKRGFSSEYDSGDGKDYAHNTASGYGANSRVLDESICQAA